MKHILALSIASLALAAFAEDKACAFGYCMGQDVSQYADESKTTPMGIWVFQTTEAKAVDTVEVSWAPNQGVCNVRGIVAGAAFDRIMEAVKMKYGEPTGEVDTFNEDSLFALDDIYLSLAIGHRLSYYASWLKKEGALLPDGLSAIGVSATKETVSVSYEFDNFIACRDELKQETLDEF